MAITRNFKEAIQARALRDPEFRAGLLKKVSKTCRPVIRRQEK